MDLKIFLITCNKFKRLFHGELCRITHYHERQANLMQRELFQYEIKFNFL